MASNAPAGVAMSVTRRESSMRVRAAIALVTLTRADRHVSRDRELLITSRQDGWLVL
jgi:hypothetical protein